MEILNGFQQQIGDYQSLKAQFSGPASEHIRWLIDEKIRGLTMQRERFAGRDISSRLATPEPPPMPSWMKDYLEPSMPLEEPQYLDGEEERGGGRRRREVEGRPGASTLRPLGAQTELSTAKQQFMAGYGAWGLAGSPTEYSQGAITEMADLERYWTPYTRLSESLFPTKAKLGARWMPAKQR